MVGPHGLQHIVRGDRVLFQILARVLGAKAYIGVGRQMKHAVRAAHGGGHGREIESIATHQVKTGRLLGRLQEFFASSGKIIIPHHGVTGREQPID